MQSKQVDLTKTRLFLTHSGYVALECDALDPAKELELFSPGGVMPPHRLSDLVDNMLQTLAAAPDKSDAAGLKSLAHDLEASLKKVEAVSTKLEKLQS